MKNGIRIFITSFLVFGLTVGAFLFVTKGIWIYYGDFNVQQIPFYMHLHDLVRAGNFYYDWGTDLGGSVIGCYSFYLLGSPFFWISVPFKSEVVPYLIPWINALKYAVMASTSYLYIRRHVKTEEGAFIGALLFTFSGYSGTVLVYNHFHDFIAFFPLWLLCFEKLCEKKKYTGFILMTALMAVINYYFFFGGVVFLVIYFFCRYGGINQMLRALISGLAGVLIASWYLIPAVSLTIGNSRLGDVLMGEDIVAYSEPTMLLGILKNVVLLPDISGFNSMFNNSFSRVSGVGAYLPMVSVACVIAYFIIYKKRYGIDNETSWPKKVLVISLVFAVVPVLNALFSAMNSEYYARWYYMPVLIMSLVSVRILEAAQGRPEFTLPLLKGNIFVAGVITFTAVCSVLPARDDDGNMTILGAVKNPGQLITEIVFTAVLTGVFFWVILKVLPKMNSMKPILFIILGACVLTTATMMTEGEMLVEDSRKANFISQAIKGGENLELPDEETFYRIETEQDVYNYPMIWNRPSITAFISTVPPSIIDFYDSQGLTRKVTSKLGVTRVGARTLLGGRYYLVETETPVEHIGHVEDEDDLTYFTYVTESNGFRIYENDYYVPMGFTFENYLPEKTYDESEALSGATDKVLMKALILDEEAEEKYGHLFNKLGEKDIEETTIRSFAKECDLRRESACTSFETTSKGFVATAELPGENLVFFSVPYDPAMEAYVDGEKVETVKVDYGFTAVYVPEGIHEIECIYRPSNNYKNLLTKH